MSVRNFFNYLINHLFSIWTNLIFIITSYILLRFNILPKKFEWLAKLVFVVCAVALIITILKKIWAYISKPCTERKMLKNSVKLLLDKNLCDYIAILYNNYPGVTVLNFNDSNVRTLYGCNIIQIIGTNYRAPANKPLIPFMLNTRYEEIFEYLIKTGVIRISDNGHVQRTSKHIHYDIKKFFR